MFIYTRLAVKAIYCISICVVAGAPVAHAQAANAAASYPTRPIRIVVPFTPGGQPDIFSRMIAHKAGESLGQPIVIDNRPGAGGTIGSKIVAEASADGHTLLSISGAHVIGPSVRKVSYDTRRDFAGVTMTYNAAYLLVVPPALGIKTARDLIALAKAKPGQLNLASAGAGSGTHFAGEMFKFAAGVDVVHIPFRGIPEATNDIMANRVQLFMSPLASAVALVRDGRLMAIGVSSPKRIGIISDIPTLAESGLPGFRFDSWGAMFIPAKTPRAIINKLNRAITSALGTPVIQKQMRALGAEPSPTTPEELDKFVATELITIAKLAKAAGITRQ